MLFTSITFAFFLIVVFILYWFVFDRNLKAQNIFLLLSSYFFYGWWDWRFLFLLFFISVSNYFIAILIQGELKKPIRELIFISGLLINVGTLIIFKYFNFFIDGIINLFLLLGIKMNTQSLNIILPIGISFYIFLSLSYIIDIYQNKFPVVRNFFDALLAFSFFPIILAGPIQRPISLLPQIQTKRIFNYYKATDGLKQILWGVFMKLVVADNCAVYVDSIFLDSAEHSGSTLIVGIFLFTIQIYADFAGYSNIAIGLGKLLGFNIMQNFAYPYFARNIREFWKRWNISLTTWFRDYVFLPIAYALSRNIKKNYLYFIKTDLFIYVFAITTTWTLTGLWHGANTTFIIWGLIHGFFLIMNHIAAKPRRRMLKRLNVRNDNILLIVLDILSTFMLVMFSWIFFRSESMGQALSFISKIFSMSTFSLPAIRPSILFLNIIIFLSFEWLGRKQEYVFAVLDRNLSFIGRWSLYLFILFDIGMYMYTEESPFLYFQF